MKLYEEKQQKFLMLADMPSVELVDPRKRQRETALEEARKARYMRASRQPRRLTMGSKVSAYPEDTTPESSKE